MVAFAGGAIFDVAVGVILAGSYAGRSDDEAELPLPDGSRPAGAGRASRAAMLLLDEALLLGAPPAPPLPRPASRAARISRTDLHDGAHRPLHTCSTRQSQLCELMRTHHRPRGITHNPEGRTAWRWHTAGP